MKTPTFYFPAKQSTANVGKYLSKAVATTFFSRLTESIVELKRDSIGREDIGQVFEYYGLMRQANETVNYKMILVAPSILAYRRIPLEEFGFRCFEVPHRPESIQERAELVSNALGYV